MSAASPTESAVVSRVDLDLVGVAAAVLDYSDVLDRLSRLSGPLAALEDSWVVRELASLVTVRSMNTRATRALGMDCETPAFGHVSSMFEVTSGMLESFKAQFTEMLEGSLTSQTEQSLPGERFVLVDWRASDASYRNVVVTLRDVTAARLHAERWASVSAQMARLGRATSTIARRLDSTEVRRETVSQVCQVLDCDQAALVTVDLERGTIEDVVVIDASGAVPVAEPAWSQSSRGISAVSRARQRCTSIRSSMSAQASSMRRRFLLRFSSSHSGIFSTDRATRITETGVRMSWLA